MISGTSCYEAAREYLRLGLHPIPCAPKSKRPVVEWRQYQEQAPLADEVDAWWERWPGANVALVLGRGTFAVDLDGGFEAEKLLIAEGVYLPGAPRVQTAGGFHVYLASPGPVPDRVGLLSTHGKKPQVDIRGVGIVVAPPSVHPTGAIYTWHIPLTVPFPAAPSRLLELISGPSAARDRGMPQTGWVGECLRGVGEGQRDATCTRLAGYFLSHGLEATVVEEILCATFAPACTPPFDPSDVKKCVWSIARKRQYSDPDNGATSVEPIHISAALDDFKAELRSGRGASMPTPFASLNTFLGGGFYPGELIYCGARPGVGKTALGLMLSRRAGKEGRAVLFVSREMVTVALARRMVSQESNVAASLLRTGRLRDTQDQDDVDRALLRLKDIPIWLTDQAVSIGDITTIMMKWSHSTSVGMVVVDYLQLVRAPRDIRERRLQVEAVSQGLKSLAMDYHVPVLCLSSLARAQGDAKRPTLASLRESGELEHDADVVLLLHRDPLEAETECIIAKNRDGRVGTVHLSFRASTVNFEEASDRTPKGAG